MELNHNEKIRGYIDSVCTQVRFRDVHRDVGLELEAHIEEIAEEHLAQGLSEEQAIEQAIAQMGDADIIGKQLNKVHKPKPEWSVLLFSFLFTGIGLLAMYIIQRYGLMLTSYSIPMPIFEKSLAFAVTSLALIVCLYFFDYRKLEKYSMYIYLGTLLILAFTVFQGVQVGGSSSWIRIGSFNINFVAISPLLLIIALAGIFDKWDWQNRIKRLQGFALLAVPLFLLLSAPSISSAIIFATSCIVIMIVSGAKFKEVILICSPLIAMLVIPIITAPYRLSRLLIFLNPETDPMGSGYINTLLREIISDAGLFGQGLSYNIYTGSPVFLNIHTDFMFAFITYTFGWIASILLTTFIVMFLIQIARIAKVVKINYAKSLISGFVSILAMQFLWNLAMNLGLAPISAISLPFMSYGGSQLVINAVMIGIISSIYRRKSISEVYNS